MAHVIFYEKPGCGGNARQKALLIASGHSLDVRNLLTQPWTASDLRSFFGTRPVEQWFNMASPRVKSGEIKPDTVSAEDALALMLSDPLLIRRPLLESANRREAGFDTHLVAAWLGLQPAPVQDMEACAKTARADDAAMCKTADP